MPKNVIRVPVEALPKRKFAYQCIDLTCYEFPALEASLKTRLSDMQGGKLYQKSVSSAWC